MIAQLVILAFGVAVFVAVVWWDRRCEREREWRLVRESIPRIEKAMIEVSFAFADELTPALQEAARAISDFGDAVSAAWWTHVESLPLWEETQP